MVSQTIHGTFESWEGSVGVWEDENGSIIGVVNSEGENRGEAFFQMRSPLPSEILEEMFMYAENNLSTQDNGKRTIRLRIPVSDPIRLSLARSRGYQKLDWDEPLSFLPLWSLAPAHLPTGFHIQSGTEVSSQAKALAHAKAFHYFEESSDRTYPLAFERMKSAPDYRPELDLSIVDESGEVVSFCTLWYDGRNQHGILEPVGTIPTERMKGLARAVIWEGLHRIAGYGAKTAYVGSDMGFYQRLGFQPVFRSSVWEKTV